ncbi:Protein of unknown function [Gryllus bimaculatus]|nr:Protein of unknown function [Gryllus bimaculatus]
MEAYMPKNNPVSVKEAWSKTRANIEALRYRWQDSLEEKTEFQKAMQSLLKWEEITSINKRQYPPRAQRKKREAPIPPEKHVRRGKKGKQKAVAESTDATEQQEVGGWREMKDG